MPTNIDLNRRTFLKGLGAATGIAATYAASPIARGETTKAPLRVLCIALSHGWGLDPLIGPGFQGSEFDYTIPDPLKGFGAIKNQCVFVDGVRGTHWGNAHDVSYADLLTASVYADNHGSDWHDKIPMAAGPSLDYLIEQHTGKPAMRFSEGYRGWGKPYFPLSFGDGGRRLAPYTSPKDAYDAIIDPIRGSLGMPQPGRDARRKNLFEYLGRDADRLMNKVSGSERTKLENYLLSIKRVGERLQQQASGVLTEADLPDRPQPSPAQADRLEQYFDMLRLAFRTDMSRAGVLGIGGGVDDWQWRGPDGKIRTGSPWKLDGEMPNEDRSKNFHHYIAHHDPKFHDQAETGRAAYEGWVAWYVDKIVGFAQSLQQIQDVDGNTLLDNTLIMLTGEVGTGNHDRRRKLHTLIGGGDRLKRDAAQGRWLKSPRVDPRGRNGAFLGGLREDGTVVEDGYNGQIKLSGWHTGSLLTEIARLADLPKGHVGFEVNNRPAEPLNLS